jgi:hypothetical protein
MPLSELASGKKANELLGLTMTNMESKWKKSIVLKRRQKKLRVFV